MKKRRPLAKNNKKRFLKRPTQFMLYLHEKELNVFLERADRAGLSGTEYGRRKILDIPFIEITSDKAIAQPEGNFPNRTKKFMVRFSKKENKIFLAKARKAKLKPLEYGRRKVLDIPVYDIPAPAKEATKVSL